jgi:hypothetical protein
MAAATAAIIRMTDLRRWWRFLWASPYTLLGLMVGGLGLLTGGSAQRQGDVVEFHGELIGWLLDRLPLPHVLAMTLGHTVIGRDRCALEVTRDHERVHVRQFERWGPLMGPAYLSCCAILWFRGRDAYRDNPFEREAFDSSSARIST